MSKRNKLEIIKDILKTIQDHRNKIKPTPLLRQSNISSSGFKKYFSELIEKEFIKEINSISGKIISLTPKGQKFLERYQAIVNFIDEFEL